MKIVVKKEGQLLDYLVNNVEMSRKTLKQYLQKGSIYVDGVRTTKYDYPLSINTVIKIDENSKNRSELPFEVIYEDKDIIVVDKPSGILSIATEKEKEETVYHILREYLKKKNKNAKVFVVHRLDKDTSGILLFAKSEYVKNTFQKDWNKLVKVREYTAVVHGKLDKKKDRLVNYLKETTTNLVYISKNKEGKLAITNYEVLKENSDYSKLLINIETGRKNQIRVQLANINHPILGDKKYGDDKEKRLFLHASKLEVFNPITRKTMTFTSKVPSIFNSKIK
jgi:23S rRNA pseudouridine1911/1915/1917 synthase